ncbi:hypothetical protein FHX80_112971 [Streptomyces brevispora]|uniref:DUF218 domain-containing protein n=1 Tax=Streptomyces brevispora TaxID=887462 RepID=A0A561UYR5_9ACTN|nr:hypothetical protein FHX80_112971 [Streptomyces brevispora]
MLLVSKPHMERRSFATARKLWPDVEILCASEPLEFDDYVMSMGGEKHVLDMPTKLFAADFWRECEATDGKRGMLADPASAAARARVHRDLRTADRLLAARLEAVGECLPLHTGHGVVLHNDAGW